MILLIDQGNSRIKWARLVRDQLIVGEALDPTLDSLPNLMQRHWEVLIPRRIVLASVAALAQRDLLIAWFKARGAVQVELVESAAQAHGVRNAYPDPAKLGVDRWLALLAAHQHYAGDCVLVSCGTGLTLDALRGDGRHLGGLIAPAPELMRKALTSVASRLADLPAGRIVFCADNSADAVQSGTWLAGAALVERFYGDMTVRFGATPRLLVGGGGADTLISVLRVPALRDDLLVLRGLALLAGE